MSVLRNDLVFAVPDFDARLGRFDRLRHRAHPISGSCRFLLLSTGDQRFPCLGSGTVAAAFFVDFCLLRGPEAEDHTLYASHSTWHSKSDFEEWTKSEAFRKAHSKAGGTRDLYVGPPNFEGFTMIEGI